jgi:3-oxoacyl-[acyl-carrier-protein] synthase II
MINDRRVVMTGIGAVTPLGLRSIDETWSRLKRGESGIGPITLFDASDLPVRIAGEVKGFNPLDFLDRRTARRTSRGSQLALAAAQQAVADARLDFAAIKSDQIGVSIGTGVGGLDKTIEGLESIADGSTRADPFGIISSLSNMPASLIASQFKAQGPTSTFVTACASGAQAIGEAAEVIKRGWAEVMIAGGTDALILRVSIVGFNAMGGLSKRNDDSTHASRPFDANRDGLVLSEGSAMVILEGYSSALKRGAKIYAEIAGYASSFDAYNIAAPDPNGHGAALAMKLAIDRSGLSINDIDYIHAHGTATKANDVSETNAIKAVFRDRAYHVPISSIKSMIGHPLGAAGAIGVVVSAKVIEEGIIPPTINYASIDPECDLDYVPNIAREVEVNAVLINAFGFGGQNACVVISKPPEGSKPLGG